MGCLAEQLRVMSRGAGTRRLRTCRIYGEINVELPVVAEEDVTVEAHVRCRQNRVPAAGGQTSDFKDGVLSIKETDVFRSCKH